MIYTCTPSQFPISAVPQVSHPPDSNGKPRKGFANWVGCEMGQSFMEYVLCHANMISCYRIFTMVILGNQQVQSIMQIIVLLNIQ